MCCTTHMCLNFLEGLQRNDETYHTEGNGLSIQKQRHTTFNTKLLHTTLRACFLFGEKGGKKTNNLMEIGPPFCCGNSMFGALKERTPTRDKKKTQTKERPKRRSRYHPFPLFPFFPFYILFFYLSTFFTPFYPFTLFYPLALFITFAFFLPLPSFLPYPFHPCPLQHHPKGEANIPLLLLLVWSVVRSLPR